MATEVILPRVDMDMASGRIARWHVAEGETVQKGQPLFDIETDKAAMEIEAPASGIVRGQVPAEDRAVPVGSVVAWLCAPGELPPTAAPVAAPAAVAEPTESRDRARPARPAAVAATPLARRLARQFDIALDAVAGSGPRRRIQARDVTALAQKPAPAPAPASTPAPSAAPRPALPASGRLHRAWLRRGEGRPLVLIHGFGADLNGWRPLVASLGTTAPILALDLPGHGQSAPAAAPSLEALVAAAGDALAEEGVAAADLVGHSLGGAVAACLAESAAFEVRSLLLLSPAGLGPDIDGAFLDGFSRARSEVSLAPWLRLLVADEATLGQGFVRATAHAREDEALVAAQTQLARALFPDGTQAFSIRDALGRLAMPVRVVFGADDRIIPARHARDLPGSVALHVFRGVGHMPHLEVRPALARIVAEHTR